jgi:hypothetical protein
MAMRPAIVDRAAIPEAVEEHRLEKTG